MFGEFVDLKSSDDELATLTVNVAQLRRRRHDSFQSAAACCHAATVAPMYDRVNVDSSINMTDSPHAWIGAADAAQLLGVNRATLYAYVSRGYVRSQASPGSPRQRMYARDDVERLRRRTEERRAPDKAAARALQWGMPILESSIALIDGRRLYYRGLDAAMLARTRSLEEVASLIWTGRLEAPGSA